MLAPLNTFDEAMEFPRVERKAEALMRDNLAFSVLLAVIILAVGLLTLLACLEQAVHLL
jgi:hypothetical protein